MTTLKADQYMITYDDTLGIVYAPRKGLVKTTTPEHAQAIEKCLSDYFSNQMTENEMELLEKYMLDAFECAEDLPLDSCQDLRHRKVLRRLELVVANECNLRCKYCYAKGGSYGTKAKHMTPDDVRAYFEALLVNRYRYVEIVTFFGGEPTLYPTTIKYVCEYFEENVKNGTYERMPVFLMVSNGTLIDEPLAEIIHRFKIGVTVSVDGPKEINDLLRVDSVGNGSFEKVSQAISLLNKKGASPIMLEATYTSLHDRLGYTKEDVEQYLKTKFKAKKVIVADCCSGGGDESLAYIDWSTHTNDGGEMLFADIEHTRNCLTQGFFSTIGCDACLGSVTLTPNGEIYPCHFFINNGEYQIAYYHDGEFDFSNYDNILSKFNSIQKNNNPRCTDCWAKAVCQTCPAQMLLEQNEESITADCHTRRLIQSKLILKCAKESC